MLPSNMTLKIKTGIVGYNNKILISDRKFIVGRNEKVNFLETPAISHKDSSLVKQTAVTHKDLEKSRLLPTKKRKLL